MEHLTESELRHRLEQAAGQVRVGYTYRHYKGQTYEVRGLAIIESTNEVGVVYRAQYGEGLTFMRPLTEWFEYVDGQPRFELVV